MTEPFAEIERLALERVALAICAALKIEWDKLAEPTRDVVRGEARKLLEAKAAGEARLTLHGDPDAPIPRGFLCQ